MKTLKLSISVILMVVLCITASAQHNHSGMGSNSNMKMNQNTPVQMAPAKTATLKVWGKCEMCKDRIEKIAIKAGANTSEWNLKTKFLTINFSPSRTSVEYISNKLAKAGHDTGNKSAKDKAYNALPDCCKYERIR
ncbi:MAG: copper chaperone [Odoribacter sp.]|nr:copper chaperone [Odoribacter sp.]